MQNQPRILKTDEEVLSARRAVPDGPLRATDCRRIAKYDNQPGHWVSSPNMDVIPELPERNQSERIVYFADGMLGLFEHLKWPQKYYREMPHAMAAPGNPDLLYYQPIEALQADGQDFFAQDTQRVLPSFADAKAPWFHITEKDFVVLDELPYAQVGKLRPAVLTRLQEAWMEAMTLGLGLSRKVKDAAYERDEQSRVSFTGFVDYLEAALVRMKYTYSKLHRGDLTTFHTLLWFREYQRLLLDVRAVIIYMDVIKPRLDNRSEDFSGDPLPIRGIITNNESMVRDLYRVGVPVWYVRGTESLTTDTYIHRACVCVPGGVSFSSKRGMRHGKHEQAAPVWSQAPNDDPMGGNVLFRLQKFSVTNHAIVGNVRNYDRDKVREFEEVKETSEEIAGPDLEASCLPVCDLDDEVTSFGPDPEIACEMGECAFA